MKSTLIALREHRLKCHRAKIDVTRIDDTIVLIERLINKNQTITKSTMLRIYADLMELHPECCEVRLTIDDVDNMTKFLFKEYFNDNKIPSR